MTLPVLIKTYAADAEWLYWLLRSADRFARGFGPWFVVTEPESMETVCDAIARAVDPHGSPLCKIVDSHEVWPEGKSVLHHARGGSPGYFHQQGLKLLGDLICGGDHVQIDSDCFFIRETTPELWGDLPTSSKRPIAISVTQSPGRSRRIRHSDSPKRRPTIRPSATSRRCNTSTCGAPAST